MFVKSRRVEADDPRICPCGQTPISALYWITNKNTDKQTFVGSTCIYHIDPDVGRIIGYFERLLKQHTKGIYRGVDEQGLHKFQVCPTTILVKGAFDTVNRLNPPVDYQDGKYHVKVKYHRVTSPLIGHTYQLWLQADYEQQHLVFTVDKCQLYL